jgi:integrase
MQVRRFSDTAIEAMKPGPKGRRIDVWGPDGLVLRISSGARSWSYVYRHDGRLRRVTLGKWPAVDVEKAKARHRRCLDLHRQGKDPAAILAERRRRRRSAKTIEALAEDYLAFHVRPTLKSAPEIERLLRREILPAWGDMKARDVREEHVEALLDRIATGHGRTIRDSKGKRRAAKAAPIAANRTKAIASGFFAWMIDRKVLRRNPCSSVRRRAKERPRHRILSDAELVALVHGLSSVTTKTMSDTVRRALWLLLLTGQRAGEVAGLPWSELDLDRALWRIGAARTKNGRDHVVPLSHAAVAILEEARAAHEHSAFAFPAVSGRRKGDVPIAPSALNQAIERHLATWKIAHFCAHDLRRTCASHVESLGFLAEVPWILNHTPTGVAGRVYIVSEHEREKRAALDAWAEKIEALRARKQEGAA